jgi:hypothetical protein
VSVDQPVQVDGIEMSPRRLAESADVSWCDLVPHPLDELSALLGGILATRDSSQSPQARPSERFQNSCSWARA